MSHILYDISVIVCCYNSENRIRKTLECLKRQELGVARMEVIVVDNNCSDATVEIAHSVWRECPLPLKIVVEKTPGLAAARNAGVAEARAEFVLFCDDDNWLSATYVLGMIEILRAEPRVGVVGGLGRAASAGRLPDWFARFENYYACGSPYKSRAKVDFVAGAGMAVRRALLVEIDEKNGCPLLTDRMGDTLTSGGDIELCLRTRLFGYEIILAPELEFEHFMPAGRLTKDYLLALAFGIGMASPVINHYRYSLSGRLFDRLKLYLPMELLALLSCIKVVYLAIDLLLSRDLGAAVALAKARGCSSSYYRYLKNGVRLSPSNFRPSRISK